MLEEGDVRHTRAHIEKVILNQYDRMQAETSEAGAKVLVVTATPGHMFSAYRSSPKERSGATDFLAASRFSSWPPFENLGLRFCQMSTFPAI